MIPASLEKISRETVKVLTEDRDARNDDIHLARKVFDRVLPEKDKFRAQLANRRNLRHNGAFMVIQAIRIRLQKNNDMYLPSKKNVRELRGISEAKYNEWITGTAALPGLG